MSTKHLAITVFLLAFGTSFSEIKAAIPSNDFAAAASDLGNASSVNVRSLIDEATTEPGEPRPHNLSHTVWWKWTAPDDRWVTATTSGSFCDTQLAIYTNVPSAASGGRYVPETLVTNDDDRNGGHTSRVYFLSQQGTTYWIQAGGNCTGELILSIFPSDAPRMLVSGFCTVPHELISDIAPVATVARFHLRSPLPLDGGILMLVQPDGDVAAQVFFDAARRTGGDALEGDYDVPIEVPELSPPGLYRAAMTLESWSTGTHLSASYGFLFDTALPLAPHCPPGVVLVTGGVFDDDCPELHSFKLDRKVMKVKQGPDTIHATFRLTDFAGLKKVELSIFAPDGSLFEVIRWEGRWPPLGDRWDATFIWAITLPARAPDGKWTLQLRVEDITGNACVHAGSSLPESTITVHGSTDAYDLWAFRYRLDRTSPAKDADPDGDGLTNLAEYGFCTDPGMPTGCLVINGPVRGAPLVEVKPDPVNGAVFGVKLVRRTDDPLLVYKIEISDDLQTWGVVPVPPPVILSSDGECDIVQSTTPPYGGTKWFVRVKIERL